MRNINLLIPGDFPPIVSGIATYFYEIWKKLPDGNRVIIASRRKSSSQIDRHYPHKIFRVNIPDGNQLRQKITKGIIYLYWAMKMHLKHRIKILHCGQILSSGVAGWCLNKLFKVPYVIYIYGSETLRFGSTPLLKNLLKIFAQNSNYLIANSNFTRDEYIRFGIPSQKIKVITPGVDTNRFCPKPRNKKIADKYNLHGKIVLLTVGRLDERKGHDKVIEAISILKNRYNNLVYLIVGDGREKKKLQELAETLGVRKRVIFAGFVPDNELPEYYNLCDIFILLNRQTEANKQLRGDYEGFGIVFIEASACGKPVIAGNFGGIYDAVENGYSGLIINPIDTAEITKTIQLLIENRELRETLSQNGLERVKKQFTLERKAEQILEIEKEISDG